MKIQVYSDIHNEFGTFIPAKIDTDIVILAGDIDNGDKGVRWALEQFPDKPVIYVLGNHEYYAENISEYHRDLKALTKNTNIHVLENESITIGKVRFLGCTLWTDFNLFGDSDSAMEFASEKMTDYRVIRTTPKFQYLKPGETRELHQRSLAWLKARLNQPHNEPTVIVTHHAPSIRSVEKVKQDELLSAAYASNLDEFVGASGASFWVHGHTHKCSDYLLGSTRVICNPRGYAPFDTNKVFNADLVVQI